MPDRACVAEPLQPELRHCTMLEELFARDNQIPGGRGEWAVGLPAWGEGRGMAGSGSAMHAWRLGSMAPEGGEGLVCGGCGMGAAMGGA